MDAALKEAERTIKDLGFKSIQIYTRVNGGPPTTEKMGLPDAIKEKIYAGNARRLLHL